MNLLITICLLLGNIAPLIEFPRKLMSPTEIEIVDFILRFFSKYKTVPSLSRVVEEIEFFYPATSSADGIVLEDVAEKTKKQKLLRHWQHFMENAINVIRDDESLPVDEVVELLKLTATSTGVFAFSEFDRSEYFRRAGLKTGLKLIDSATGGVGGGEVMVIAGRLGNKKTTLSLFVAHNWWQLGKRVLFTSNEMSPGDVYARLDGIVGSFNPMILRHHTEDSERKIESTFSMVKVAAKEHGGEIFIPRKRIASPNEVFALAQHLGVDGVVIDGFYLMQPSGGRFASKWERVSEISNEIKSGAADSGLPVVAVTQIKRTGGRKESYDPEDLAYSDSIGQDADFVLVSNPSILDGNQLELQLIKNRFGSSVSTLVDIDFDHMRLTEESVLDEDISESFFRKGGGSFVEAASD